MAVKFNYKKFFRDVINFLADFFAELTERIRKADRRTLIIGATGILLAVVLVIVLIASFAGGKDEEKTTDNSTPVDSYIQEEPSTGEDVADSVTVNGAGFYVVKTDASSLNMRPTAGTDYSVMATIPNGTKVEVLFVDTQATAGGSTKGWGYIDYNGKRGWVSMEYLAAAQ